MAHHRFLIRLPFPFPPFDPSQGSVSILAFGPGWHRPAGHEFDGNTRETIGSKTEHIRPNTPEYTECTQAHPGGVTRCIHGSNLVAPGRRRATKSISVLSSQDQGADSCQRGIVGGHCSCRFELRLHFPNGAPILQPARQSRHWQASRADPQEGLQLADGVRRSGLPCNTCQQGASMLHPSSLRPGRGQWKRANGRVGTTGRFPSDVYASGTGYSLRVRSSIDSFAASLSPTKQWIHRVCTCPSTRNPIVGRKECSEMDVHSRCRRTNVSAPCCLSTTPLARCRCPPRPRKRCPRGAPKTTEHSGALFECILFVMAFHQSGRILNILKLGLVCVND
jgi:hypothetical protein